MNDTPTWTLDLGPTTMTISGVQVNLFKPATGQTTGTIAGDLKFGSLCNICARYDLPGNFMIRSEFPEVKLSQLIAQLNEIGFPLPNGFDLDFQQTWIMIEKDDAALTFQAATSIDKVGLLAFTAKKKTQNGFAVGLDLSISSLTVLPGFDPLKAFEDFVGLEKFMLVISSLTDPAFTFPEMSKFNAPPLGNQSIKLPKQANGLVKGVNVYAQLNAAKNKAIRILANWLGLKVDGSIGITLAVSCPNPSTNSKLYFSFDTSVSGVQITGNIGGLLQGQDIGVFLAAKAVASIQGQMMDFELMLVVLENGIIISGDWNGTIRFDPLPVQITNPAIVVGMDWEGIPSFGFAATLDVKSFDSSIVLFFDSVNPSKSMFAGAVSDLTLKDVASFLAGQNSIPVIGDVLGTIGLKSLKAFNLQASVATALDNRDLKTITTAFASNGVTLSGSSDTMVLRISKPGSLWYLTNLSDHVTHYILTKTGGQISVTLEPQIYCAPNNTQLGNRQYPQGFQVFAEIDYLIIQAQIKIIIDTGKGIAADVTINPIVIFSDQFFSFTSTDGSSGPRLSLATFTDLSQTDTRLQNPHFMLIGSLRLLGLSFTSIYANISTSGVQFKLQQQIGTLHLDLNATVTSLTNMSAGGTITVDVNRGLDLGILGSLLVVVPVTGTLQASFNGGTPSITFQAGFTFWGVSFNLPAIPLSVGGLADLPEAVWSAVAAVISNLLTDPGRWLDWVKRGIIHGAFDPAAIGRILGTVFHLTAGQIGDLLKNIMDGQAIATALKAAGYLADQIGDVLKSIGIPVDQIGSILSGIFPDIHVDFSLGHLDTPAGLHWDKYIDIYITGTHTDFYVPPHVDTGTHIDT